MVSEVRPDVAVAEARINEALDALRENLHPLEKVVEAFRHVFTAKVRLKVEMPFPETVRDSALDAARFERGVRLLNAEDFIDFDPNLWKMAIDRMMPALELGFPKLSEEMNAIKLSMADGGLDGQLFLRALAEDRREEAEDLVRSYGVDLRTAGFVLGQVAKPLVERRAQALESLVRDLSWRKGYCPLCGSMPELAFLKGEEGRRWLKCSFCAHEWPFVRLVCPFCETEDHTKLLVHYIAGREQERVEACTACNRYILSMDLRGRLVDSVLDVAAIGLVHLDVIAQQKGFLPAAWCAWNVVSSGV
jgi:FdhE protein